jgi:dTDP-4-amino-4,6-dideoxygalactose transaminase
MNVTMTDLKAQYESIKDEIDSAIKEVINESGFILGEQVNLLEEEIARYLGVKFAVGVASGTDALVLSLVALGIGKGDEVITTPFTFIATAEAISRVGAKPVFCDIDHLTYNIDAKKIEEKITKCSKAILPVHLYGLPCDMSEIIAIAKENQLNVIEDCAQSFGSEYKGRKVGALGDCGCFSFFPAKTLGCYGDGGMVVTNDEKIAIRLKMLRNHGSSRKYYYTIHGFNSRLDTLQTAIVRVKLKYVNTWINKRIENAKIYNELLSGVSGVTVPAIPDNLKHSFNYYTIRMKQRDTVQKCLEEKGIATAIYYPLSLHLQEVYEELGYSPGDFLVAEEAQSHVLSLPMYPELNKEQVKYITDLIKEYL